MRINGCCVCFITNEQQLTLLYMQRKEEKGRESSDIIIEGARVRGHTIQS